MKIVCASGYFDPLHIGHIEYLRRSAALGDKLIVIVNNDWQAEQKKGFSFMSDEDRRIIIESLGCVNKAVISIDGDGTVSKTLELLHFEEPIDIWANGGDVFETKEEEVCNQLGILSVYNLGEKIRSSRNYYE